MDIKWLTLLMVWSISTTSVILIEISSADPSIMSVEASHYLTADTNLKNVVPNEELRRTQRSFLKNVWKNTGLKNVFCDRECVACCNNNENNVDEGDTFESPVNPAYNTYIQQLAPLPPLPLIHPLWMFEPFLRPTCLNSNGPKRGRFESNFDGSNRPSKWEAGNSNALQNGYGDDYINSNSKIVDGSSYKNLNENKANIDSNSDTSGISSIKNTSNIKKVYINVKPPREDPYQNIKTGSGEVSQYKEVKTTSSGIYPTSQDADKQSNLVYQPIIYVSPQYQLATPSYSSSYSSNKKAVITQINKSAELKYPEINYNPNKYTVDKKDYVAYSENSLPSNQCGNCFEQYCCGLAPAIPPFYNSLLPSNLKDSEKLNLQFPSLAPASKYVSSDETLFNHRSHFVWPYKSALPNSPAPSPSIPSTCEGGSVYGDPNLSSKDIAVYTIVKQIPNVFTSALQHQPAPPSITLTELDQPYRDCPELFTNYLNQNSNNQNRARVNTFVNAQYICC